MRRATMFLALAGFAVWALTTCDSRNSASTPSDLEQVHDSENPAVHAPRGWPLHIGDIVTWGQRLELRRGFPTWGGIVGMHLVGDKVYGARFVRIRDEPGRWTYEGHFPKKARAMKVRDENKLPPEFRGKVEYDPLPRVPLFLGKHPVHHGFIVGLPPSRHHLAVLPEVRELLRTDDTAAMLRSPWFSTPEVIVVPLNGGK